MRYNANPWLSYRQVATKTATPGQLVLMLFDGALRFLDKALVGFDLDDPLDSNLAINNNILKAQEILRELNMSLNMEKVGRVRDHHAAPLQLLRFAALPEQPAERPLRR